MAFKKGQPGGPGRPPGSKNGSTFAKEWAEREGWARAAELAMGRIPKVPMSVQATMVQYLIDRAYGRATAAISVDIHARLTLEQIITGRALPADSPTILTGEVEPPAQLPPAS